jgi:hypothetical protein
MNKPTKKQLKEWSLIVRKNRICEKCGKTNCKLDSHHLISKTFIPLSLDVRNGCCLCSGCHTFGIESAHKGSIMFVEWFKNHRPKDYEYILNFYKNFKKS